MAIGGVVFISAITVFVRLHYFGIKFKDVAKTLGNDRKPSSMDATANVAEAGPCFPGRQMRIDKSQIRVVSAELQRGENKEPEANQDTDKLPILLTGDSVSQEVREDESL